MLSSELPTPLKLSNPTVAWLILAKGASPVPPETWPMIPVCSFVSLKTRCRSPLGSTVVPTRLPTP